MTQTQTNVVDETVAKLGEKIRYDGWMSGDIKAQLKEDMDRLGTHQMEQIRRGEFDAVRLVQALEEGWRETLHWRFKYEDPIREAVKEVDPDIHPEALFDRVFDETRHVWRAFHDENDTYDIANKLLDRMEDKGLDVPMDVHWQ